MRRPKNGHPESSPPPLLRESQRNRKLHDSAKLDRILSLLVSLDERMERVETTLRDALERTAGR